MLLFKTNCALIRGVPFTDKPDVMRCVVPWRLIRPGFQPSTRTLTASSFLPSGRFLNQSRLLLGLQGILGNIGSLHASQPTLLSTSSPSFGCSRGFRPYSGGCGECGSLLSLALTHTLIGRLCLLSPLSRRDSVQGRGVFFVSGGNLSG